MNLSLVVCLISNLIALFLWSESATGQVSPKNPRSFPMPPNVRDLQLERFHPSSHVPDPIENYSFEVTGEVGGNVLYTSEVPLYYFEDGRVPAGFAPVGSEFKADKIRPFAGRHYYGNVQKQQLGTRSFDKVIWIDGQYLKLKEK